MKKFLLPLILFCCALTLASAPNPEPVKLKVTETIRGKQARPEYPPPITVPCVRVIDADTIKCTIGGRLEKVRLIGIDTPERRQKRPQEQKMNLFDASDLLHRISSDSKCKWRDIDHKKHIEYRDEVIAIELINVATGEVFRVRSWEDWERFKDERGIQL